MGRNNGAIHSRIKKLGLVREPKQRQSEDDWFDEYEEELFNIKAEKANLEERIKSIRAKILQQMEERGVDNIETAKLRINYYPSRTVMQFDDKTFKKEQKDMFSKYCTPKEKEAAIVVRLKNKDRKSD